MPAPEHSSGAPGVPGCFDTAGPCYTLFLTESLFLLDSLDDRQLLILARRAGVDPARLRKNRVDALHGIVRYLFREGPGSAMLPLRRILERTNAAQMQALHQLRCASEEGAIYWGLGKLSEGLRLSRLLVLIMATHGPECDSVCRIFWQLHSCCITEVDIAMSVAEAANRAVPTVPPTPDSSSQVDQSPPPDRSALLQVRLEEAERRWRESERARKDAERALEEAQREAAVLRREAANLADRLRRQEEDIDLLTQWIAEAGYAPNWPAVHAWIRKETDRLRGALASDPDAAGRYAALLQAAAVLPGSPVSASDGGTGSPLETPQDAPATLEAMAVPPAPAEPPAVRHARVLIVGGDRDEPYRSKLEALGLSVSWLSGDPHGLDEVRAAVRKADLVVLIVPRVSHAASAAVLESLREAGRSHDLVAVARPGATGLVRAVTDRLARSSTS